MEEKVPVLPCTCIFGKEVRVNGKRVVDVQVSGIHERMLKK